MIRLLLLCGAVAAAAAVSAPAASATPVCERVAISGDLQSNPPQVCVPWSGNTICDAGSEGIPGVLTVYKQICVPSVFGGLPA